MSRFLRGKCRFYAIGVRSLGRTLEPGPSGSLYRGCFHSWAGCQRRSVKFGFRWFAPEGIGSNALLRLNGKRIVLRSAISWGWWAPNGLFPSEELAEKEVQAAKALGLNCLQFHRNIGHPIVLDQHDQLACCATRKLATACAPSRWVTMPIIRSRLHSSGHHGMGGEPVEFPTDTKSIKSCGWSAVIAATRRWSFIAFRMKSPRR